MTETMCHQIKGRQELQRLAQWIWEVEDRADLQAVTPVRPVEIPSKAEVDQCLEMRQQTLALAIFSTTRSTDFSRLVRWRVAADLPICFQMREANLEAKKRTS